MSGIDYQEDDLRPGMFGVGPAWAPVGHQEAPHHPPGLLGAPQTVGLTPPGLLRPTFGPPRAYTDPTGR